MITITISVDGDVTTSLSATIDDANFAKLISAGKVKYGQDTLDVDIVNNIIMEASKWLADFTKRVAYESNPPTIRPTRPIPVLNGEEVLPISITPV